MPFTDQVGRLSKGVGWHAIRDDTQDAHFSFEHRGKVHKHSFLFGNGRVIVHDLLVEAIR